MAPTVETFQVLSPELGKLEPAPAGVTAEQIVARARMDEAWIANVQSFAMRIETAWHATPRGIEKRREDLRQQFKKDPDVKRFSELWPERTGVIEFGWDNRRIWFLNDEKDVSYELSVWDGDKSSHYTKYFTHAQEEYSFSLSPKWAESVTRHLSWLRAGQPVLWFRPDPYSSKEEFELRGKADHLGVSCYVLEARNGATRWYVGVADGRLRGLVTFVTSREMDFLPMMKQVADAHGKAIADSRQFNAWIESLDAGTLEKVSQEYAVLRRPHRYPLAQDHLLDWREVAPGKWMPMKQGYGLCERSPGKDAWLRSLRSLTVTDVKVDAALPEAWFKPMVLKEGVEVNDTTHDPPLFYEYKAKFEPAEWEDILRKAKERVAMLDDAKRRQASILQKPAFAFPAESQWLNGEALTWDKLKGKVVVLHFFADWCGPCKNDYQALAALHAKREQNGIVVIGIHTPGSKREAIEAMLKTYELKYPICIDQARDAGGQAFGRLSSQYQVLGIPHACVIDPAGTIIASGFLGEVLPVAYRKAAEAGK